MQFDFIINQIIPIFLIVLTGWFFRLGNLFDEDFAKKLLQFVFFVAIPALLFIDTATRPVSDFFQWKFIIVFGGGLLISFFLVFILSLLCKQRLASASLNGLCASMSNTAFIALPLLLLLFGERIIVPSIITILFVVIILFPLAVIIINLNSNNINFSQFVYRTIIKNPMIIAPIVGFIYSAIHIPMPVILKTYCHSLGTVVSATALFAIGLDINFKLIWPKFSYAILIGFVKLIIQPAIVLALGLLLGLSHMLLIVAVVVAAVPSAKSCLLLAQQTEQPINSVIATIILTTIVAVVTLPAWLWTVSHLSA